MKIAKLIPVFLLGLVYVVFGSNFFLNFIPMPKEMPADMAAFSGVLFSTGYLKVIKIMEITFGLMLFIKPTRALAQILIAPITVGILLVELLIVKQPGIAVVMVLLNALAIYFTKEKYLPIVKN